MGLVLGNFGFPPMAGRVFGALLVADPPEQTAEDLADTLQASRGAISGAVQLLETMGLVERRRKPGDRRAYFLNKPNAWYEAFKREMLVFGQLRKLVDEGLELLPAEKPEVTQGLRDMQAMMTFWEDELPPLFAKFERQQRAAQAGMGQPEEDA